MWVVSGCCTDDEPEVTSFVGSICPAAADACHDLLLDDGFGFEVLVSGVGVLQ